MTTTTAPIPDEVRALLEEHAFLQLVETTDGDVTRVRVRCDLTQHELLPRKDAIEAYLKTKKFIKAKEWYCYDYSKYEPYIVAHHRKPKCLYCNVTSTVLNRIPSEVEKHVNGKRFKRQKEHVKIETRDDDAAEGANDGDFNANAFEFENQQLIWSDEEGDEGDEAAGRRKRGGGDDDDSDASDDQEDNADDQDEEQDDGDEEEEAEDDDEMADFYPQEGEDDGPEDEHIRKAVARITGKKRGPEDDTDTTKEEPEAQAPKAKKPKAVKPSKPMTEKPPNRKELRQQRRREAPRPRRPAKKNKHAET